MKIQGTYEEISWAPFFCFPACRTQQCCIM
nr:MAG TPA: hypothetical protein [Caudoviricetes sp.]